MAAALALACAAPGVQAATDPSFLLTATSRDFDSYFPGQLANGYFSVTTSPRGTEGNLSYVVALMDHAKDDMARPAAIPGWSAIDYSTGPSHVGQFWMNQADLTPQNFQGYRQVLDMHDGTLTTAYRYVDNGRVTGVRVTGLVSQASPHLAAKQITITPEFDGVVELSFPLDLWAEYQPRLPFAKIRGRDLPTVLAAHRLATHAIPPSTPDRAAAWYPGYTHVLSDDGDGTSLTLWLDGRAERGLKMAEAVAVGLPRGLEPVEVKVTRNPYKLSLDLKVRVHKDTPYTFTKYVAVSRQDWGGDAKADVALARAARDRGFDALLADQKAAWAKLWRSDIRIEGDPRAQLAVHSDLYYLLSNTTPDTSWGVGACGLTTGYVGHVFWDADSWILPALLLFHPERARTMVMFRDRTLPAAQERAKARGLQGAKYPWEADPQDGSEQILHAAWRLSRNEIHVNADIALAQWQYWLATHDMQWLRHHGWPVIRDIARFWASRATLDPKTGSYEILHVTSVEEHYFDVPNDTYTNLGAAKALRIATRAAALVGAKADPRWMRIADHIEVPFSESGKHHLDMDASVLHDVGGSDLAFLAFPSLDVKMSAEVRHNDYTMAVQDLDASSDTPNTMGLAPVAIAAAADGDAAEAARWVERNYAPDMFQPPFNVRSETATNNTGYFLTGSGGFLQSLMYGLTGLRIENGGLVRAYRPVLPPTWTSMTLRNVRFRGTRFDMVLKRDASGKPVLQRIPASSASHDGAAP